MTALVCKNPQTSTKQSLNNGVNRPQNCTHRCRGNVLRSNKTIEDVESRGKRGNVPEHVVETCEAGSFETVLGNSITDIVDRIVWQLELVAVCINKLSIGICLQIVH